eukprot:3248473-Pyramimonas_sp.AAC.1
MQGAVTHTGPVANWYVCLTPFCLNRPSLCKLFLRGCSTNVPRGYMSVKNEARQNVHRRPALGEARADTEPGAFRAYHAACAHS